MGTEPGGRLEISSAEIAHIQHAPSVSKPLSSQGEDAGTTRRSPVLSLRRDALDDGVTIRHSICLHGPVRFPHLHRSAGLARPAIPSSNASIRAGGEEHKAALATLIACHNRCQRKRFDIPVLRRPYGVARAVSADFALVS